MFIIKAETANKYFMKDHKKVIVFNSYEEAHNFLTDFDIYAKLIGTKEALTNPELLMAIYREQYKITALPKNFDKPTINFEDCKKG